MTTYYVDNQNGSDTSPYDTWGKAAATIANAVSAGAGANDIIKVHTGTTDPHSETAASAKTITAPNTGAPLVIIGVDKDDSDAYLDHSASSVYNVITTGANDITLHGSLAIYGIWFNVGDDFNITSDGNEMVFCQDCKFKMPGSTGEDLDVKDRSVNCIYDTGASGLILDCQHGVEFINPTFISSLSGQMIKDTGTKIDLIGADLTSLGAARLVKANTGTGLSELSAVGCVLHATNELYNKGTSGRGRYTMSGCDTVAGNDQWRIETYESTEVGTITLSESVYRDSAATYDGSVNYSLAFETGSVNHREMVLYSEWNSVYVAAGDGQNVKVYCAHTGQLKDDDIFIQVEYFSATANTLKTVVSSRGATILDAAAAMANAAGETWTGIAAYNSDTGQYMTLASDIDIKKSGMLRWRIGYTGVSSSGATIYVCPKIEIV